MLDDRPSRVLEALVEEYIRTGEPVSSRVILDRSGVEVSSATIRNDLAKLESYGFVAQPHTSAGRIPTDQGYRYYVDHCSPVRLQSATRVRIESFFAGVHHELSKLLRDTTGLLSDLSHYPAIVIGPGISGEVIRGVHLVTLTSRVLLVVTVTGAGRVTQEIVSLGFEPTADDLTDAESHIAACFVDRPIAAGDDHVAKLLKTDLPDQVARVMRRVVAVLRGAQDASSDLFVEGTSQLASLWEDLTNVHSVLGLLERDAAVRSMLDVESEGTTVRIGSELDGEEMDLSVVSTTYEAGDSGSGRVGVIGPTRMDYRRTMKLVEEFGEGLGDSLGR